MHRILAALSVAYWILGSGIALGPRAVEGQRWNDARTRALVERATARRAAQLADTGLRDYRATAHGYLAFLAQVGEGFPEPPKIVKADELALEVYWRAPNLSKQRIVGRRDTLLLPTDINYHRDHLGIVQNNFPDVIRLGEGDEVTDVPHPFSPAGLAAYDFAISDSLSLRLPDRTIELLEVSVRPVADRAPRVIGAAYIDRESAEVVRMAFSFTRAAFLDRHLEDISIVLENSLIDGRYWLPSRQEIEIRRTGAWLDYPARGIIRGRWEICCYAINVGLERSLFAGPEIVAAPQALMQAHPWTGRILDSLPPDVRAVRPEEIERVQAEARRLVRADALARARSSRLAARTISDFVRVNRVEGLALGAGVRRRLGSGISLTVGGRYGFSDREGKGRLVLQWQRADGIGVSLEGYRAYDEAGDLREVSLLRNSLAAQEFGSDYTDPFDVRGGGVGLTLGSVLGAQWSLRTAYERHAPLEVHATPARGTFAPTIDARRIEAVIGRLVAEHPTVLGPFGTEIRGRAELRGMRYAARDVADASWTNLGRIHVDLEVERPVGDHRLVSRTMFGWVEGEEDDLPPQSLVYLGGPVSAPGYDFHSLAGTFAGSQRVEWRFPVPFVALPLGRFGRAPARATLAPFALAAHVSGAPAGSRAGWYPVAGAGLLTIFDQLRFDVARGLRDGRWTFSVDIGRDFWSIL